MRIKKSFFVIIIEKEKEPMLYLKKLFFACTHLKIVAEI